jgi:hypothetical protein
MIDTTPESWTEPIPDRVTFSHPRFGGDPRYGPELVAVMTNTSFADLSPLAAKIADAFAESK